LGEEMDIATMKMVLDDALLRTTFAGYDRSSDDDPQTGPKIFSEDTASHGATAGSVDS